MNNQKNEVLFWLSMPVIILVFLTSFMGTFFNDLVYRRETLSWTAQGIGQDIISLFLVVPILIASSILMRKGSQKALLVLLGTILYTLYSYTLYSFYMHFGPMFLPYISIMGLSLFCFVFGLINFDLNRMKNSLAEKIQYKYMSYFLYFSASIFCLLWLKTILSAYITSTIPSEIIEIGMPNNPVWILDLALFLPAMAITANLLFRKKLIGFVLSPLLLIYSALLGITKISMMIVMNSYYISLSYLILSLLVALVLLNLYLLKTYFNSIKNS